MGKRGLAYPYRRGETQATIGMGIVVSSLRLVCFGDSRCVGRIVLAGTPYGSYTEIREYLGP